MNFYQQLQSNTEHARQSFLQAPIIQRCFNGDFNLNDYIAFLQQAYHHVKFTVPLLMATGAKLNEDKEWLREAIGEYIEEEIKIHFEQQMQFMNLRSRKSTNSLKRTDVN